MCVLSYSGMIRDKKAKKHGHLFVTCQRAKKVVSDSPGLEDFAIRLVNSVFNLPDGQVMFYEEFEEQKNKTFLGLVEMTSGLVNASFSLPEWQAVKMIFFAPCLCASWCFVPTMYCALFRAPKIKIFPGVGCKPQPYLTPHAATCTPCKPREKFSSPSDLILLPSLINLFSSLNK